MNISTFSFKYLLTSIWPIYRHEMKRFLPLFVMLFLLSFNQSVLWNLKDALVITTAGAEVIPFIKVWAILPSAILFTFIYTYLSNRYSQEKVFYLITSSFLVFFGLFAFVLYPQRDQLHPLASAAYLEGIMPQGFKGLLSMYRYWTFTCFYVMCELWNTMIISVLFWGFANRITPVPAARRYYGILSFGFNLAIVAAGLTTILITQNEIFSAWLPMSKDSWETSMSVLISLVILSGLLTMGVFKWLHCSGLQHSTQNKAQEICKKPKARLSLLTSLRQVGQSKYLICIAVMVVGYSLVINLIEVVWKDQIRNLYPSTLAYNNYIGNLQMIHGGLAIALSLGMAEVIKRRGWTKVALATPVFMALCCVFFFGLMFFQDNLKGFMLTLFGLKPLAMVVMVGSILNCSSKACKYSIFDSTKEMAFVPLDLEAKVNGKTAIDGIGVRFGKSGGSIIHQGLLIAFASVSASAPYVAGVLMVAFLGWILAVRFVGKQPEMRAYCQSISKDARDSSDLRDRVILSPKSFETAR